DLTTLDLVVSDPSNSATDGADSITTGAGNDIVLGGNAGDTISAGEGNNVVLGDYGRVELAGGLLELIVATNPTLGGGDQVTAGAGDDRIIGGQASDNVDAGDGANIVLGDSGKVTLHAGVVLRIETLAPLTGGRDTVLTGSGKDVVLGGLDNDSVSG